MMASERTERRATPMGEDVQPTQDPAPDLTVDARLARVEEQLQRVMGGNYDAAQPPAVTDGDEEDKGKPE